MFEEDLRYQSSAHFSFAVLLRRLCQHAHQRRASADGAEVFDRRKSVLSDLISFQLGQSFDDTVRWLI